MSLADYLAKKYLTADPQPEKKPKKRKRKGGTATDAGLIIADDDATGWEPKPGDNEEDDDSPYMVAGSSAEFRKSKKSGWVQVGAPAPSNSDQAAADAIIASATAENEQRLREADDAPVIEGAEGIDMAAVNASGTRAGLQTGAQVAAAMARRKAEENRRMQEAYGEAAGATQETIYRDASGRIINVAMKRAEARKAAEEEERKKKELEEAAKGDAQKAARETRKKQLEDAKYLTVARTADDVALNEELKEQERWNDPAAQFITTKKKNKSVTGKPLYQGGYPPNRYGIRPGHRWDGVDRGNGFESKWFAARNQQQNRKALEYAWEMDE
ncbi:hypothetical protein EJ06DRAFT_528126 [Trichodelitschia bisporula]|uniref:Pre-mRNA-splicing factor cwc26 n=1 Tax=Trichodelitschia bisporula TaxID=703511 RepID=A0A6G1I4R2_9PEZI|nr:hypothetical protein EJ06DRAFT_528126 [Trichodelitschia bisporula]